MAETVALPDICIGAYEDLKRASEVARRMVIEFGMSEEIGPVFLGGDTEVFIAKDWGHQRNYSEQLAAKVDSEIRRILDAQFDRAKSIVEQHRDALERVKTALVEYERIDGDEFEKLYNNQPVELVAYSIRKEELEKPEDDILNDFDHENDKHHDDADPYYGGDQPNEAQEGRRASTATKKAEQNIN